VDNNTQITATVPAGAVTGKVVVFKEAVTPIQSAQSATDFTVITTLLFAKHPADANARTQATLTGVESAEFANGVAVYPNPATETLTVQVPVERAATVRITLTTLLGERVMTVEEPATAANQATTMSKTLDVRSLPAGTYLLEVQANGKRFINRFVKN
jgi:hypothetical protein